MSKSQGFTHRVEVSPLLGRLESFLPQMKKANEELEENIREHGHASVDIENVDNKDQIIQMSLSLGVLEEKADENEEGIKLPGASTNSHGTDPQMDIKLPWEMSGNMTGDGQFFDMSSHDEDDGDSDSTPFSDDQIVQLPAPKPQGSALSQPLFQPQAPIKSSNAAKILHDLGYEPVSGLASLSIEESAMDGHSNAEVIHTKLTSHRTPPSGSTQGTSSLVQVIHDDDNNGDIQDI